MEYFAPEDNLPELMENLQRDFPFLKDLDRDTIIDRFKEKFKFEPYFNGEAGYIFDAYDMEELLDELKLSLVSNIMWNLVQEGKVELGWDDKVNDFVFSEKQ